MSSIFNPKTKEEKEFTASKLLDDARVKVDPDGDMAFVKVSLGVLGNKKGNIKTGGAMGIRATGGAFAAGFGSMYCVADTTIPFRWEYGKMEQGSIMKTIAEIQNKLSAKLTAIQGKLDDQTELALRESAIRSRAIREAKTVLQEDDSSEFDQRTFNAANVNVRAGVITDMSLEGSVRCTFAIAQGSERVEWAISKGYKEVKGKGIYSIGADEKGLKKIYLVDAAKVEEAQIFVFEIGSKIQDIVTKQLSSGWTDEVSKEILTLINATIPGEATDPIKPIPEFTAGEIAKINDFRDTIVADYRKAMEQF